MYASQKSLLKLLLSLWVMGTVFTAPAAFAKKDLFANEPGNDHATQAQSIVTTSAPAKNQNIELAQAQTIPPVVSETKSAPIEKKPSYLETQLVRFKGHLVEAKEDLFGSKKSSKKITPDTKNAAKAESSEDQSSEDAQPDVPVISATEAAQRAQTFADGQVINVRQYQDEGNQRYAVKLLQKNGRMKTINLNAVNGELIEETTD
ncbi:MAG: hypothetical protein EOO52_15340 [Gammaproteobacteria bacterium]|nr:MAG: hypothetical protein EOO52_15340 [Gammaproteobacteria bacterium]